MTKSRCAALAGLLAALLASTQAQAALDTIRMSSVGFRPSSVKTATFLTGGGFTVRATADGAPVFHASLDHGVVDGITGQTVYIGDFSALRTPGRYYLELANCERSPDFVISSDVYLKPYQTMMLGFYGQRCGVPVAFTYAGASFAHDACHRAPLDVSSFDGANPQSVLVGGWHDAGDYGRYTVNGGFTAGLMLRAWEDYASELSQIALSMPDAGGSTPDFLIETRWQLEWLLKMEYSDASGRFSNAVKSPDFPAFVMPESDGSPIALASASSMGTAVAAAVLAHAARVYRLYDAVFADACEQAAVRAYSWLTSNLALVTPAQDWAAAYDYSDTPGDETAQILDQAARLWAAAEIWATTDSDAALADFEARAQATAYAFNPAPDWVDPSDLGIITYLQADNPRRSTDVVDALSASVLDSATALQLAHDAADNSWGRAQGYWWGANGTTARSCLVLQMAERVDGEARWMDICAEQVGYLMGRNPYGRSQVTGIGVDPPLHPHHRPSSADGVAAPWPGLLIGGPQFYGSQWLDWVDSEDDYRTNETAINWNAALVYAFAGLLSDDPGTAAPAGNEAALEATAGSCAGSNDGDAGAIHTSSPGSSSAMSDAATSAAAVSDASLGGADAGHARPTPSRSGCGCTVVAGPRDARRPEWLGRAVLWLLWARRWRLRTSSLARGS